MVRTQIYLTEKEKSRLESIAKSRKVNQSDLIREAIDEYLGRHDFESRLSVLRETAGIWEDRKDHPDVRKTPWRMGNTP